MTRNDKARDVATVGRRRAKTKRNNNVGRTGARFPSARVLEEHEETNPDDDHPGNSPTAEDDPQVSTAAQTSTSDHTAAPNLTAPADRNPTTGNTHVSDLVPNTGRSAATGPGWDSSSGSAAGAGWDPDAGSTAGAGWGPSSGSAADTGRDAVYGSTPAPGWEPGSASVPGPGWDSGVSRVPAAGWEPVAGGPSAYGETSAFEHAAAPEHAAAAEHAADWASVSGQVSAADWAAASGQVGPADWASAPGQDSVAVASSAGVGDSSVEDVPGEAHEDVVAGPIGARFGPYSARKSKRGKEDRAESAPVGEDSADSRVETPPGEPTPEQSAERTVQLVRPWAGALVRPYAHTGGRTRSSHDLALEALVSASGQPSDAVLDEVLTTHHRRMIVDMCLRPRSVAEVAALLSVPLGVARVLLGDLATAGVVVVHPTAGSSGDGAPDLAFMQRVLVGLRRL